MVVLLSDGLNSLFPGIFDTLTLRILSFVILTPMLFFPVRYLSYSSLLGIISAVSIIIVMLVDGFSKREAPGSLWEPAVSTQIGSNATWNNSSSCIVLRIPRSGHQIG